MATWAKPQLQALCMVYTQMTGRGTIGQFAAIGSLAEAVEFLRCNRMIRLHGQKRTNILNHSLFKHGAALHAEYTTLRLR